MSDRTRSWRWAAGPGLLALAWLAGFGWFIQAAGSRPPIPPHVDAIVALTGGAERVETAMHLLAEGRAPILLVSGVGGPTEFGALARRAGIDPALGGRVTLGRSAASTHGNALETAEWARANAVRSLLVVTAGYHMPRAMAELARALPDVALYPAPVRTGWPDQPGLRLLAGEYTKYLATASGLSRLAFAVPPRPEPVAGGSGVSGSGVGG